MPIGNAIGRGRRQLAWWGACVIVAFATSACSTSEIQPLSHSPVDGTDSPPATRPSTTSAVTSELAAPENETTKDFESKAVISLAGANTANSPTRNDSTSKPTKDMRSLDELLLFFPTKVTPETAPAIPAGIDSVWIESVDGTRLNAWFADHPAPAADVLFLHGNGGSVWGTSGFVGWLQRQAECRVLALDYRGYGLSEGTPTIDGAIADARAAREWIARKTGQDATRIVLAGHSLGGALAVQLTQDAAPRGLVLQSTFSSLKDVARHHYGMLSAVVGKGRLDSVAALQNYDGPLLQSHGDNDNVIPFELGERLYTAAGGPKEFLRLTGADHNRVLSNEYLSRLRAYLHSLP